MARQRERIVWSPVWDGECEKWVRGFIRKNLWRCDPLNDIEDHVQEAWFVFQHVAATYPRITDPSHFMALFRRAMINKIHDKSCHFNRRKNTVEAPISVDVYEVFAGRIGEVTNSGYVAALYNEAPEELKLIMNMLAEGKFDQPAGRTESMDSLSARIKSALGLDKAADPIAEIRQLLTI